MSEYSDVEMIHEELRSVTRNMNINTASVKKGNTIGRWNVIHVGKCLNIPTVILENNDKNNGSVCFIQQNENGNDYLIYSICEPPTTNGNNNYYSGNSPDSILDSGTDILAQKIFANGEPNYEEIKQMLPALKSGAYTFLGGVASWGSAILLPNGDLLPQQSGSIQDTNPIFSPVEVDAELGRIQPKQFLLDGWIPVVISRHRSGYKTLQIMYFVEPSDPDREPLVWIRAIKYDESDMSRYDEEIFAVGKSRDDMRSHIDSENYWDALSATVAYWTGFEKELASFQIPDKNIFKCIKGSMASLATTFSGDHPHYGHRFYGIGIHDNFPPTFLTAIETYHALGMDLRARRLAEHIFAYSFDSAGRFAYRQWPGEVHSSSGSEYGQWLWLVNRIESALPPNDWIVPYIDVLVKTGRYLCSNRVGSDECNGYYLIKMCAEADTSNRIFTYASNNLWAVLGLEALSSLLDRYHRKEESIYFKSEAESIENEMRKAFNETMVMTEYGPLVPFQFGYTATPWNLSVCRDTSVILDAETYNDYISSKNFRDKITREQDLSENTYANYRYYLEMLSSTLLKTDEAEAIVNMRERLGGELLGMSRLYRGLDDWPAANYARFLLTNDHIDKYLMLMYAHMAHHGNPDLMIYYEQVTIDGGVVAPDCVPSLLLVPIMSVWMVCFEPIREDALYLLRGIPTKWLDGINEFSFRRVGCTFGKIDLEVKTQPDHIEVSFFLPEKVAGKTVYLDLRLREELSFCQVIEGGELLQAIEKGYRLRFKQNLSGNIRVKVSRC